MEMDNVNVEQVEETIALFSSMDLKTAVRGLLFLVVGLVLVRLALMLLSHMLKKSRTIPASAHTMIKTLMRILLDVVVVLAAANTVGIPITSFMVFLSVIGIAISLAVQGILSNFAGGILLLVSRPFAIGDFIECHHAAHQASGAGPEGRLSSELHGLFIHSDQRVHLPHPAGGCERVRFL